MADHVPLSQLIVEVVNSDEARQCLFGYILEEVERLQKENERLRSENRRLEDQLNDYDSVCSDRDS